MDEQTLEPCPFCGEPAELFEREFTDDKASYGNAYADCSKCGAGMPYARTKAEAIAAWNRRAAHSVIAGKVAEQQQRIDAAIAILSDTRENKIVRVFDALAALAPYPERRSE